MSELTQLAKLIQQAKLFVITLAFCLLPFASAFSQEIWITEPFIQTQGRLNKDGAIGLSSWAFLNAGYSGYQLSRTSGQEYHFHKMNLIWSGIDLAVGIPTFIRSHRIYKGKVQLKLDKYNAKKYLAIYSLNSWLDVAYIATGFIVKSRASHSADPNMLKGYGNSIIMQGGFLFSFDTVMYLLHRKLYKNHINNQSR